MHNIRSFIGGEEITGSGDQIFVNSPIDGQKIAEGNSISKNEAELAFTSAHMAFLNWKQIDYKTRIKYILAFASKLKEHSIILSQMIHQETGKNLKSAHDEVQRSYDYIIESVHAYSDMMEKLEEYDADNNILIPEGIHATYVRFPLGVVLTISPFNYPVNLMITKVIPAILVGNAVVHKSSSNGCVSGWYIAKLFHEAIVDGCLITPGVFNYLIIKGSDLGDMFSQETPIDAFSFTGSSEVGNFLSNKFSSRISLQLELGGHNPAVVMQDADLDLAVQEIMKGAFSFSGQRCTSIKRVLVHNSVRKTFLQKLEKALDNLKLEEPLISQKSVRQLHDYYKDALVKGAVPVGKELLIKGNYVTPVVFQNARKGMKIYEQELFAPILFINYYECEEEIIHFCNDSKYGLQASIFGNDVDNISDIALKLEFGRVNINVAPSRSPDVLPFGGLKNSGMGFQSILESLLFFTTKKGILLKKKNG